MPDSASHSPTPPMLEIQLPDMANSTSLALPIQLPNPAPFNRSIAQVRSEP
ncbi:hypothetical protein PILCRDRAFT_11998 [Piloderma croceum F 1598]|uniref:Uncharacterized protein n=1 Tax=Piloderma croceum (strain F 1598) TaxID=765440 RepID=A0A0C3AUH1_PILCF|nr:hypothetical protein PILCRDRAFT_11998 [Piloderma croceum F 1598]